MAQKNFMTFVKKISTFNNSTRCCSTLTKELNHLNKTSSATIFSSTSAASVTTGVQSKIFTNFLKKSSNLDRITTTSIPVRYFTSESKTKTDSGGAPQILSKLFPQTSEPNNDDAEKERKKQEEENRKEKENSWKRMKIGFAIFGASAATFCFWAIYDFGSPERGPDGQIIEDEFSHMPIIQQYLRRMWKSLTYYQKMIQEPSREKLLPDTLKPPYIQPPYTLVLEMKDVLVHPDWTYQTGWRFKKRPGVDFFLEQSAKHFEIVVFTADQGMTVFPILDALDPHGYIMYRLVRDATHFVDGHHVKNLDNLNRDLRKVIVIDWDPNSTKLHPDNTFNIARWAGNDDDTALFDLVAFLKTVATADVDDVREVLNYYRQFDDPLAQFRENQRKLYEQMQEKEREEKLKQKPIVKKWTPSFMSRT